MGEGSEGLGNPFRRLRNALIALRRAAMPRHPLYVKAKGAIRRPLRDDRATFSFSRAFCGMGTADQPHRHEREGVPIDGEPIPKRGAGLAERKCAFCSLVP